MRYLTPVPSGIYGGIYVHVSVRVKEREREKESSCVCMCLCVSLYVCMYVNDILSGRQCASASTHLSYLLPAQCLWEEPKSHRIAQLGCSHVRGTHSFARVDFMNLGSGGLADTSNGNETNKVDSHQTDQSRQRRCPCLHG
jgi:hypothetical protein